jgi:hypothetical protein
MCANIYQQLISVLQLFQIAAEKKCYKVVEECVQAMGGSLVPFHALVTQLTAPSYAAVCQTAQEETSMESLKKGKDDVSTFFASLAGMSACSAMFPCSQSAADSNVKSTFSPQLPHMATLVISEQGMNSYL